MKTLQYTTVDRSQWKSGPWDGEPDKLQWEDPTTKLACLAVRHTSLGHWCGYVGVPLGHPWFQQDYDNVDADVHGGLTYGRLCADIVCHEAEPGEPEELWWLGFDCAHCDDLSPGMGRYVDIPGGQYRTLKYVQDECARLARQAELGLLYARTD